MTARGATAQNMILRLKHLHQQVRPQDAARKEYLKSSVSLDVWKMMEEEAARYGVTVSGLAGLIVTAAITRGMTDSILQMPIISNQENRNATDH
jgi:hypothetical protein